MKEFSDEEKQEMWREVREEFPDDEMMQEIHYVRLMHYYQTKDMTPKELKEFYSPHHHHRKSA